MSLKSPVGLSLTSRTAGRDSRSTATHPSEITVDERRRTVGRLRGAGGGVVLALLAIYSLLHSAEADNAVLAFSMRLLSGQIEGAGFCRHG